MVGEASEQVGSVCAARAEVHEADGAHYTMVGPEHVLGFQKKLTGVLAARGLEVDFLARAWNAGHAVEERREGLPLHLNRVLFASSHGDMYVFDVKEQI